MTSSKLTLKNMVFYGHHGVFPAEKELGQRIEVDVELISDFGQAAKTDDLNLTINYVDIYNIVKEIVEERAYNLIEGIAVAIADIIMTRFNPENVTVRVRKPQPPAGGLMDAIEFEVSQNRE